jgi:hypothetical protein
MDGVAAFAASAAGVPADCGDHRHLPTHQVGRKRRQSVVVALRETIFKRHITAVGVTNLVKTAVERSQDALPIARRHAAKEPDHRHCRLLRARHERPCSSPAAD